jgi:hypothetical protein
LGFFALRSFSPVARVRSPLGSRGPTCRFRRGPIAGSGVRFYVPRCASSKGHSLIWGLAAFGFWAFTPSTSRAFSIAGPAIASIRMGRSTAKAAAAVGFSVLSQVVRLRTEPSGSGVFCVPALGLCECKTRSRCAGHRSPAATSGAYPLVRFSASRYRPALGSVRRPPNQSVRFSVLGDRDARRTAP